MINKKFVLLILFILNCVSFAQYIYPNIYIDQTNIQPEKNITNAIEREEIEDSEQLEEPKNIEDMKQIEEISEQNNIPTTENFIMDYNLIDIIPLEPEKTNFIISNNNQNNNKTNNKNNYEDSSNSHKHSLGIDFGTTIFSMFTAPLLVNSIFKQPENSPKQTLNSKFGLRLTYTYRILPKLDLDATLGFYIMNTYYTNKNSTSYYFGETYGIPLSFGLRFYFNKKNRASGFFILPKIGATILITKGNKYENGLIIKNKNDILFDFHTAFEMGFRIDISKNLGINSGVRAFIDISIVDFGVSYSYLFRFVPLPRLAIGILF
jgi:outer membrane protein W